VPSSSTGGPRRTSRPLALRPRLRRRRHTPLQSTSHAARLCTAYACPLCAASVPACQMGLAQRLPCNGFATLERAGQPRLTGPLLKGIWPISQKRAVNEDSPRTSEARNQEKETSAQGQEPKGLSPSPCRFPMPQTRRPCPRAPSQQRGVSGHLPTLALGWEGL
jgi:hypothetical protein